MSIDEPDQGRRTLLRYAAWGAGLAALGVPVMARSEAADVTTSAVDIDALLSSMKAIGQAYLDQYPQERSHNRLMELLQARMGASAGDGLQGFSWNDLQASISNDFATDELVFLNGWAFARTEARLYALAVA